jgi:arylsulfatase A-like enzyme
MKQPRSTPWFLYLAFNAPHTPLQSTAELQERVKHIEDQERKDLAALIVGLDDAVGDVLSSLDASGQREKTLVFFFSDNGGPITVSKCSNSPLRAGKGSLYEGGMRVPFLVSWPSRLPGNVQYADPVISLDVFATAVSLAEASVPSQHRLEGVNLIPHLTGANKGLAHERLFWRTGGGSSYAVREGNWKLVGARDGQPELYDLGKDIGETTNLAEQEPQVLLRMLNAYREWDSKNIAPIFESPNGGPRAGRKE